MTTSKNIENFGVRGGGVYHKGFMYSLFVSQNCFVRMQQITTTKIYRNSRNKNLNLWICTAAQYSMRKTGSVQ